MYMAIDRVLHQECGLIQVDLTLGVDVFRLSAAEAQALGCGLLEASQPADVPTLSELSS